MNRDAVLYVDKEYSLLDLQISEWVRVIMPLHNGEHRYLIEHQECLLRFKNTFLHFTELKSIMMERKLFSIHI